MASLVTGGAGFIGSHLVDFLMKSGETVSVLDNLSAGNLDYLSSWLSSPRMKVFQGDVLDKKIVREALKGCDTVFHLAANPEVRSEKATPQDHFKQNIEATYNLLECIREVGGVARFVFASTSTVYGEPSEIPTPETYGPLKPISYYGASKLASEALSMSYASMCEFGCVIYRLANVIGSRSNHGVIYDFVTKLKDDPSRLEVLGDGTQSKSYLYVDDCIAGIMAGLADLDRKICVYNVGSDDRVDVVSIANAVIDAMALENVEICTTGGVGGGRGWKGDVKTMQLDMSLLNSRGWKAKLSSMDAVRETARSIVTVILH
ncbi:MAG: NAD-dependent epimerase/dehydratase family protein [Chloroflexi bacterium]|nr:NAD-dependent epimerase/dehydratase family protein [Chloroflexota bacterium]